MICCGGGGIPVYRTEKNHLKGAAAVIDKDFASELLAEQLNADMLIILTAVEKVAVNFQELAVCAERTASFSVSSLRKP